MKTFFTSLFLCCILAVQAQMRGTGQIMMMHPSVGNTITLNEKQKFGLFPQQPDSTFEMAQLVKYDDTTYTILFRTACDGRFENTISINELLQMYIKIESIEPAPILPPVLAPVLAEAKRKTVSPNKNEVSVLDALGNILHSSEQLLVFVAEVSGQYHSYQH